MNIQLVKIPLFGRQDLIDSALDPKQLSSYSMNVKTPAVMSSEAETINSEDPSTWDSPEARLVDVNAKTIFLTKEQLLDESGNLNLTDSNLGDKDEKWNAILYVPTSDLSSQAREFLEAQGAEIREIPDSGFVSITKDEFEAALIKEGYEGVADYLADIKKLKLGSNTLMERAKKVVNIYKQLKNGQLTVNRNFAYASLLREMLNIERIGRDNGNTHTARSAAASILETLKDKYGLELKHEPQFIFARKNKGATLIAEKLGVVIKTPGDEPGHTVDFSKNPRDIKLTDGGVLKTARHQMQLKQNTETGLEEFLRSTGIDSEYSVVNGIEIQKFIKGDTLEELLAKEASNFNPREGLSRDIKDVIYGAAESLVTNGILLDRFGLEQTDWSASGFKVYFDDHTQVKLKLVDVGNIQRINPDKNIEQRLSSIKNLTGSFHLLNGNPDFQKKVAEELNSALSSILASTATLKALGKEVNKDYGLS